KGTSLEQKDWGGSWSESPLRSIPDPVEGEEGHTAAASAQTAPQQTDAAEAATNGASGNEVDDLLKMIEKQ
ncbi:hypothetical protein, partial [Pontiella sp.]|uniref:hypothetical protein n=1 Tax=Pontiella sp. TaxID=2837462 RepID=UPI0035664173